MEHIDPMLLTKVTELPIGPEWIYEPKLDGWRIMAEIGRSGIRLMTRGGNNVADEFPTIVEQLPETLPTNIEAILDCELIGVDAKGYHRANTVRSKHTTKKLYVFDVPRVDKYNLVSWGWSERQRVLGGLFIPQPDVQRVTSFTRARPLERAARNEHMEGIVAKRISSTYQPGKRTNDWVKYKFSQR